MAKAPERPASPIAPGAGGGPSVLPPSDHLDAATAPTADALGLEREQVSQRWLAWRKFRRHRLAMGALIILVAIGLAVLFASLLAPHGFRDQNVAKQLLHPGGRGGLMGTDELGRDQFSRLLYGGRISLAVGLGVAIFSTIIGTVIGAIAGYRGGWLDDFLMRVTDTFLAIPLLVVAILARKLLGGSTFDIVIILSGFFWMPLARIVRGLTLSLKEKEFVEAARSVGASGTRIIRRHVLPNCMGPIVVNATLSVAVAIITESTLSFLGFGVDPGTPTWGNMLFQSRDLTTVAPWLTWFPGLAILITVLCVNFLGDGMRDALDPTQRRVRA